jgi:hypothetical protein
MAFKSQFGGFLIRKRFNWENKCNLIHSWYHVVLMTGKKHKLVFHPHYLFFIIIVQIFSGETKLSQMR